MLPSNMSSGEVDFNKKKNTFSKSFSRWDEGPKSNNVDPILVVFADKEQKDLLWTKLSMKIVDDMVKRRSSIAITNVRLF